MFAWSDIRIPLPGLNKKLSVWHVAAAGFESLDCVLLSARNHVVHNTKK